MNSHSSTHIHPTAIVSPHANIATDVRIDPFAVIEANVTIGQGTHVMAHSVVCSGSRIGSDCHIHPFSVVGGIPQDLKFKGEETELFVGDRTTIREYVTLNRGTASRGYTRIGSDCLVMAYSHIAHDCVIGNHVIIGNGTQIAGEVLIDDHATLSAAVLVHQFVHIGAYIMLQGGSKVSKDIPPYTLVGREPISFCGINSIGLKRNGFSSETIFLINDIYRTLYQRGLNISDALQAIRDEYEPSEERDAVLAFINASERGIVRGNMD